VHAPFMPAGSTRSRSIARLCSARC
jgi:hypothetical protein